MFVTLEGIDGSGKSTQVKLLAEALGADTLLVREPGGTALGERLRAILKDPEVELGPLAETMLFCAARAELVATEIAPALKAERDVVCDRFIDSTVAYQGVGRGLGVELVDELNKAAIGGCGPDLTVLLRIDPVRARERAEAREGADDRFELEGLDFQERIAVAFDAIAAAEPDRVLVVDAAAPVEQVHAAVLAAIEGARR